MTRTLADMTPAERAACVGMWCDSEDYGLVVLADLNDSEGEAIVIIPVTGGRCWAKGWSLTPRFDLPRAWTPSGEPVPGEWDDDQGKNLMRRWVSDWEWKHDTPQHIRDEHERKA